MNISTVISAAITPQEFWTPAFIVGLCLALVIVGVVIALLVVLRKQGGFAPKIKTKIPPKTPEAPKEPVMAAPAPSPEAEPTEGSPAETTEAVATDATPEEEVSTTEESAAAPAIENVSPMDEAQIVAKQRKRESRRKRRKRAKKMRILDLTEDNDIRYRGPLSYRALRIIAWVSLILWQIGMLCAFAAKMDANFAQKVGVWTIILPLFRDLMTPLFLVATFAIILNNSRKFSSLLVLYGGFSILFYALFMLLHDRYAVGIFMLLFKVSREEATPLLDMLITAFTKTGYFSFNIFIDLFLCTLFTCFVLYRPKRVFVGKKLIIFRLLAILPAAYEVGSIVVKALASVGTIVLPTYVYPLLTTKPPMTFGIFVVLTFFIKRREWLFRRNGKTHEQYVKYLGSNLNSRQFSSFVSLQFFIFAILDLMLAIVVAAAITGRFAEMEEPFEAALQAVNSWGLGGCVALTFAIPFIMLFSYTRTHKNTQLDLVINLVGLVILVLVYLEALYQGVIYELDVVKKFIGL
ncbi:MAG: hypothetical protein II896_00390 [Clostridia bacterium]|nr:hypothetical protein [Clostridia bacterium]